MKNKKKYYCLKIKKVDQDGNALTGAEFTATRGSTTINKSSAKNALTLMENDVIK